MSPRRVEGKAVIVTGAAKGIGRACAEVFAREGARLVLNDVDEAGLRQAAESLGEDVEVATVVADVSVEADARRIVATALERFGAVDSLVANAGIIPLSGIEDAGSEEWDAVMAVDGRGMFLTCKFAVEAMGPAGGSIVCLSSISGVAGQSRQAVYGPAKFVASGLTKHLAVELAPRNVRVNAVARERSAPRPSRRSPTTTSSRCAPPTRWAGWAIRARSPRRSASSPPTPPPSSPARSFRSTAATWLSRR